MPRADAIVISCEHASNAIPRRWRPDFSGPDCQRALGSHRGWDPGALQVAKRLAKACNAPLVAGTSSRLLIDLNRSLQNNGVFSEWSKPLPAIERQRMIDEIYLPYRQALSRRLEQAIAGHGRVLHLSVHSFTPVLDGKTRNCDFALLYDPARKAELALALEWQTRWRGMGDEFPLRRNYPYRGAADGSATAMRKRFRESNYLGFELEINQRLLEQPVRWRVFQRRVCELILEHATAASS